MSDLAQTALEFARECLGWQEAITSMWGSISNNMVVQKRGRSVVNRLRYTDLNQVMAAVRGWLGERAKLNVSVQGEDCVVLIRGTTDSLFAATTRRDLCEALMSACVAASRNS